MLVAVWVVVRGAVCVIVCVAVCVVDEENVALQICV